MTTSEAIRIDHEEARAPHVLTPYPVRVLIADDDPVARRGLRRVLTRGGFEVTTAPDPAATLAAIDACPPDIVLLGFEQPAAGLALVRTLKAAHGAAMHIAILSGWSEDDVQDQWVDAGADEHLLKSMAPGALQRHLVAAAVTQRAFIEARRAREHADRTLAFGAEAASMIAHDLNNDIAAVLLTSEYLARVLPVDADQHESFEAMRQALQRMRGLVSNFVDIARFEDECLHPDLDDIAVHQLIAAVLRTQRQPGGPTLVSDCPTDLRGFFDGALVERVLHNLVGNALRYCREGGTVRVRARSRPAPDHSGGVEISVHNPGPQVPPELAARLFSKYAHGPDGRRGMGLYFCRLVCETHRGSIALVPEPDGPTFRLTLPGLAIG